MTNARLPRPRRPQRLKPYGKLMSARACQASEKKHAVELINGCDTSEHLPQRRCGMTKALPRAMTAACVMSAFQFGYRRPDNLLLRFLFFREAQVGLRYVDQDRTICLKRDGARKVEALLRVTSELFRPTGHASKPTQ